MASLLREIGGGRWSSAQMVDGVLARSGGNPFFIEQLAAADGGEPADRRLPPGLRDVLAGRLGALPERTRQVLRGAAAAGRRVDGNTREVLGLTVPVVAEALRPAVAHGVLVDAGPMGGGYAFHHALLAEVAYGELLQGERVRSTRRSASNWNDAVRSVGCRSRTPSWPTTGMPRVTATERSRPCCARAVQPRLCMRSPNPALSINAPSTCWRPVTIPPGRPSIAATSFSERPSARS